MVGDTPSFLSPGMGAAGCASPSRRHRGPGGRPSHLGNKFQPFSARPMKRLSQGHTGGAGGGGLMPDRPQPPRMAGGGTDTSCWGQALPPNPCEQEGEEQRTQSTIPVLLAEPEQPLSLPSLPFPTTPASTLSINNTLNCMASVWIGWGSPCCSQKPSPFPTGSRVQSSLLRRVWGMSSMGNVVGIQLPGTTAKPFKQLHKKPNRSLPEV